MDKSAIVSAAQFCLDIEEKAINSLKKRLGESFLKAVETIYSHEGKVVVCGMGKSGHISQKIAATFCSTGTPAIFLHAGEARHGDLGIYQPGDPTILISKSGSTTEIVNLIPFLKNFNSPIISIVANLKSEIARHSDIVLDATVKHESDPLRLAPTSSALTALAWGDALASGLIVARNFKGEDFARLHPAGQLSRNLLNSVKDVMRPADEVAWVGLESSLREIVIAMSKYPQGAACVVGKNRKLLGIITEGDIRRTLQKTIKIEDVIAKDMMTKKPVTVDKDATLADAINLMENRPSQIYALPVLSDDGFCCGLIRLHDAYQPQN